MQKKYIYLTLAIFLVVICTIAVSNTFANTNGLTKIQVTNGTVAPNIYHASDTVEWNITVHSWLGATNAQPNKITNLTIFDVLPPGETFVTGSNTSTDSPVFTVTNNGTYNQILEWNYGTTVFQADPEVQVTYNVSLYSNIPDGTFLTNNANWSALVQDPYSLNWNPQSATGSDSITVAASPSNISTSFNTTSPITIGTPFQDSATLNGFVFNYSMAYGNANVTFYWSTDDATWNLLSTVPAPANGGQVNSPTVIAVSTGTYYFKANYTGNSFYKANESVNASEIMVIKPTYSTTTTYLSNTSITLGGTVHDTANVTFPVSIPPCPVPTGTVTFSVELPNTTWVSLGTLSTVWDNNTKQYYAVSVNFTPLAVGTYCFNATYSGDGNYNGSYGTYDSDFEILHVAPFTPTVTTSLNASTITLGQNVTDTAIVVGLGGSFPAPTGNVTFGVESPSGVWTTYDGTPNLNTSGMATSGVFTPTQTGIYHFNVTYNGDGNYNSNTSSTTLEVLNVTKATPTVTTGLHLVTGAPVTSILLGTGVTDTATVTGLGGSYPVPTGTVTFSVQLPNGTTVPFDSNHALASGVATSTTYFPLTAGTYHFIATYNGDGNYTVASSVLATEPLTVNATTSTICTTLSNASITIGGTVYDTANVTFPVSIPPYPVPTGTVTFMVELPNTTWVSLGTLSTVWDNSTKQYYAVSVNFTPSSAGTYYFNATYVGDGNYTGSTLSVLETLTVNKAPTTVTTSLNASTITLGQSVTDNMTTSTTATGILPPATGTAGAWSIWAANNSGMVGEVQILSGSGSVFLPNTLTSPPFTPTSAGTWYFNATYVGDGNYTGSTLSVLETLTVNKAPTTVTTQLNATTITLGQSVTDNDTVTTTATGSLPFATGTLALYAANNSGMVGEVTIYSGSLNSFLMPYSYTSPPFTPTSAGTWYFNFTYSGDGNYTGNFTIVLETLTVNKAPTTVTTSLNASTITLGQSVTDNMTITTTATGSLPPATGTWTIWAANNSGMVGDVLVGSGTVSGSLPFTSPNEPFTPTSTGTWYFQAIYVGDGNYSGSVLSVLETVTVGKATSNVTTTLNASSIVLGSGIYDNATVTGSAGVPTGFVLFQNNATGIWVTFENATLINGMASFAPFYPYYAGTFFIQAVYSGDGNYSGSTSALEIFNVTKAPSTTKTLLNASTIVLGGTVHDTANVTFSVFPIPPYPVPTGTVTFSVELTNGTWVPLGTASLIWDATNQRLYAVSSDFTPTQTGTYYFNTTYSGDGNYTGSNEPGNVDHPHETLVVTPATPLIQTILNATSITLGQSITDEVIVWGLPAPPYPVPTGNATFQYNGNGTWVTYDTENLTSWVFSVPFTPPYAGIFYFRAIYNGDGNYTQASSCGLGEQLIVNLPTPTITTTLSNTPITVGGAVYDNATITGYGSLSLSGAYIQFWYMAPGGQWTALGTPQLVTNANGGTFTSIYTSPPLNVVGSWYFMANYTGNNNYLPGASAIELLQVQPATPCVSTSLSAVSITLGTSVYDNVTVTGLTQLPVPTGTVQFKNNDTGTWVTYDTETLVNGMATSAPFTPTHAGTFWFLAVYSGDSIYASGISGPCEEFLIVNVNPTTIVTTALNTTSITLGSSMFDTATVIPPANSTTPTGTVQFYTEWSGGGSWSPVGSPVTLVNGVATSGTFTPSQTGTYYFMAAYSGDSSHNAANSTMAEILTVSPFTPGVQTWINGVSANQTITLGQTALDTATIWGLPSPQYPAPTGTVQFYWKISGGNWNALGSPVSASAAISPTLQPNATGTYYFMAAYSGDSNYVAQNSSGYPEVLTVGPTSPWVQTTLSKTSIVLGQSVSDLAIVWGSYAPPYPVPTGTVQFYWSLDGVSWTAYGSPVTAPVAVSPTFQPNATGTYYFMAAYSGDSNYNAVNSTMQEVLTVKPVTPWVQTWINGVSANQTITVNQTAFDKAIVWGSAAPPFPVPTGTVQFYWEISGGNWTALGSPIASTVAISPTIQFNQTGTYYFMAVYSGDSNYNAVNSTMIEVLTVVSGT